jgi:hypothetical protein
MSADDLPNMSVQYLLAAVASVPVIIDLSNGNYGSSLFFLPFVLVAIPPARRLLVSDEDISDDMVKIGYVIYIFLAAVSVFYFIGWYATQAS